MRVFIVQCMCHDDEPVWLNECVFKNIDDANRYIRDTKEMTCIKYHDYEYSYSIETMEVEENYV